MSELINEEFINGLVNSKKYAPLSESDATAMSTLLKNTNAERIHAINEGSLSGDVAQFTPILMPLVRRVYPRLIANELLGVQPMTMPTGYIYALVNNYIGDGNVHASPNRKAIIVEVDVEPADIKVGDTVLTSGKVLYIEGKKVLVGFDTDGTLPAVGDLVGTTAKVTAIYSNEAAFYKVLPGYTGSYATATGEVLGTDMKEIGFSVTKKSIEAKTRALKGRYTVEMYQDLKAQHGLLADEEIMSLMSYEIQAEVDREIVNFVNAHAKQLPDTTFPALSGSVYNGDGRWEIERYRTQAIRIAKEAALIGVETKRGQGNILLVSPKVATMLQQVGSFKPAPVGATSVDTPVLGGVAGIFDGRFKVVVDQYASNDYVTVMYRGADRRDAMGFFAPYVPLSFTRVTEVESGQPAVIAKMRYGLTTIPGVVSPDSDDRAQTYARSFGVDFSNTVLSGADYTFGKLV